MGRAPRLAFDRTRTEYWARGVSKLGFCSINVGKEAAPRLRGESAGARRVARRIASSEAAATRERGGGGQQHAPSPKCKARWDGKQEIAPPSTMPWAAKGAGEDAILRLGARIITREEAGEISALDARVVLGGGMCYSLQ